MAPDARPAGGGACPGNRVFRNERLAGSEAESRAELKLAGGIGVADLPEASAGHARSRVCPIRLVEHVKRVRLQREAHAFLGKPETFAQRHVRIVVSRAENISHGSVPGSGVRFLGESSRIEPALFSGGAGKTRIKWDTGNQTGTPGKSRHPPPATSNGLDDADGGGVPVHRSAD